MDHIKDSFIEICKNFKSNLVHICKWLVLSIVLGVICGIAGAAFHHSVDLVTELRGEYSWIVFLMPVGGIAIVFVYNFLKMPSQPGTNNIIEAVRQENEVPVLLAPAIFITTVITHLVGGSSGREGAALQIGGSIATALGKALKLDKKSISTLIICGMTAVFAALFGTPITAAVFSMEVISVGVFYYASLFPCILCGITAYYVASLLKCSAVRYPLDTVMNMDAISAGKLLLFAVMISVLSIIFVHMMHGGHHIFGKIKNLYIRVLAGSAILIVLYLIFGNTYLGAGMGVVENALYSQVNWYDFIMKAIFTAITIGCGFKGGEIVPTFFIGATFGYIAAPLVGIDPHIGAALGMVGLFCCVVNAPLASIILSVEIFGINNFLPFVLVVAICFVLSDYFSLYESQKFIYSKTMMRSIESEEDI